MDIKKAYELVRRYARAIEEGHIEARQVAAMSDKDLAEFDDLFNFDLKEKQKEAEQLAAENQ